MGENLGQILRFYKFSFLLAMLVLLICVQVVQTKNNESNWKGKKKKPTILYYKQKKDMWTCQESNLVDKI